MCGTAAEEKRSKAGGRGGAQHHSIVKKKGVSLRMGEGTPGENIDH